MIRKQVQCPYCRDTVLPECLDSHLERRHADMLGTYEHRHLVVICPHCVREVLIVGLQRHLDDSCIRQPIRPGVSVTDPEVHAVRRLKTQRPIKPKPEMVVCSKCQCPVRADRLQEHLTRRCKGLPVKQEKVKTKRRTFRPIPKDSSGSRQSPVSERFLNESSMPLVD